MYFRPRREQKKPSVQLCVNEETAKRKKYIHLSPSEMEQLTLKIDHPVTRVALKMEV